MIDGKLLLLILLYPLVVVVAAIAIAMVAHRGRRFSLRTLLIAMTFVAVILGLTAYALTK